MRELLPVDVGDVRIDLDARHMVLRALVHRYGDGIAWRIALELNVGVGDAEVGVAVLHVIFADRFQIGSHLIGIIDVAVLDERQEVHLRRLHQAVQPIVGKGLIADKFDFANARLVAFIDGEHEVRTAVGQGHQPISDFCKAATEFLIRFLDTVDVRGGDGVVETGARFRLHLDRQLVAFDLAVALEGDAIEDDAALDDGDDHPTADDPRVHFGKHAGVREILDALVHILLVDAAEIGADRIRIHAVRPFDDDSLRIGRGTYSGDAKHQAGGKQKPSNIAANEMHLAWVPHVVDRRCYRRCTIPPGLAPSAIRKLASFGSRRAGSGRSDPINLSSTLFGRTCKPLLTQPTSFRPAVASMTRFMVDQWLTATADDQAQDIVRGGEDDEHGHQRYADPQSDLLSALAQGPPPHRLDRVK